MPVRMAPRSPAAPQASRGMAGGGGGRGRSDHKALPALTRACGFMLCHTERGADVVSILKDRRGLEGEGHSK